MPKCGIYRIHNKTTDKSYIGSSDDIAERWRLHTTLLRYQTHSNRDLQSDYNLYGLSDFTFDVIEECGSLILLERETYHVQQFGWPSRERLYNRRLPQGTFCADAITLMSDAKRGGTLSEEHKAKISTTMSTIQKGRQRGPYKKHLTENCHEET